jgi:hypothetical protein
LIGQLRREALQTTGRITRMCDVQVTQLAAQRDGSCAT